MSDLVKIGEWWNETFGGSVANYVTAERDGEKWNFRRFIRNPLAARITELETALAEAEGRVKAITIALHDAIRRPMGQVPESADPFYSPAMAEQAEARRVARSQALSELAALETGDSPSPPPVV